MTQSQPKSIHKLSQDVINKICAGEVIHRPLNVVKELLENSIDAGATQVTVTLKNGGLKMITIQDNGSGIRKEDLPIVCNRFTTSKLSNFDDLSALSTFGFRGEALSSVSTVSHLSIQSKTADSVCGYKAEYFDGDLQTDDKGGLKPVAMNQGTTIFVEDLFFNMPTRKHAMTSESSEFGLVLDMMERYALLHSGIVSLALKKASDSIPMVSTKSTSTLEENVGLIFGDQISQKLLHCTANDERLGFEAKLYFTSSDLNLKRTHFILFINQRLVDSNMLKNSIKDLYRKYLMKGGNPFVLFFLTINPKNIDVNVHPTKSEVCFLYENEIIEKILQIIEKRLLNRNSTDVAHKAIRAPSTVSVSSNQSFESRPRATSNEFAVPTSPIGKLSKVLNNSSTMNTSNPMNTSSTMDTSNIMDTSNTVANISNNSFGKSFQQPTLSFVGKSLTSTPKGQNTSLNNSMNSNLNTSKNRPQKKQIRNDSQISRIDQYLKSKQSRTRVKRREFSFDSLKKLRQDVLQRKDEAICKMFRNSTFIGSIDENYFLIQYQLDLIMINAANINSELFYQIYLLDFGNFTLAQFNEPLQLEKLIGLYFRQNCPDLEDVQQKIQEAIETLCSRYEMFDDYFSLKFNPETKCLEAIPRFIDDHLPLMGLLPDFLYHLTTNVNYDDEDKCFSQVGVEIAKFYSRMNPKNDWKNLVENRFYPLYKSMFFPSTSLASNQTITTLTNTTNLYKVFERC